MGRSIVLKESAESAERLNQVALRYYRVTHSHPIRVKNGEVEFWVVEFDESRMSDPTTEPLVVGISGTDEPVVRILWRDSVWVPATRAQVQVLRALVGISPRV